MLHRLIFGRILIASCVTIGYYESFYFSLPKLVVYRAFGFSFLFVDRFVLHIFGFNVEIIFLYMLRLYFLYLDFLYDIIRFNIRVR